MLKNEIQDDKPMKGGRVQLSTTTFTSVRGKVILKTPSSYIIPLAAVEEMNKLLDGKEENATLTLVRDKMSIEVGPVILIAKLLTGPYPEYGRVIPGKSASPLKLHREELIALLRQVSLFTSEANSGVRFSL